MRLIFIARAVVALAFLGALPAGAAAQRSAPGAGDGTSFSGWVGIARHAPGGPFGVAVGNDVSLVGLRVVRTVHVGRHWAFDYTADLLPAAWVSMPSPTRYELVRPCNPARGGCEFRAIESGDRLVYGIGAAPLGAQLRFARGRRIQPFLGAAVGVLWFREDVPQAHAARRNVAAEAGAGVMLVVTRQLGVQVGYKLQHLSNAGTGTNNPGLDSHMFHVGLLRLARGAATGNTTSRDGR